MHQQAVSSSWWLPQPPIGFTAEALKRAPQMSNSPEGRRVASVQGLQEQKLIGKARSAMRLGS